MKICDNIHRLLIKYKLLDLFCKSCALLNVCSLRLTSSAACVLMSDAYFCVQLFKNVVPRTAGKLYLAADFSF